MDTEVAPKHKFLLKKIKVGSYSALVGWFNPTSDRNEVVNSTEYLWVCCRDLISIAEVDAKYAHTQKKYFILQGQADHARITFAKSHGLLFIKYSDLCNIRNKELVPVIPQYMANTYIDECDMVNLFSEENEILEVEEGKEESTFMEEYAENLEEEIKNLKTEVEVLAKEAAQWKDKAYRLEFELAKEKNDRISQPNLYTDFLSAVKQVGLEVTIKPFQTGE